MRIILGLILAGVLGLAPCGAAGQDGQTAAEAERHRHTMTVTPSERGCAVALSA